VVEASEIGWGAYGDYEGPFYKGKCPYLVSSSPGEIEGILAVITATEGGSYDAINMYDGQILSTTLIQVTERSHYSASSALGYAITKHPHLIEHLQPAMDRSKVTFKSTARGWRFHHKESDLPVTGTVEQCNLMLGCTGLKGSWGPKGSSQREHACTWAACVASFWGDPDAQKAQIDFISPRLFSYAFYGSAATIRAAREEETPEAKAFVAAYLSFAVNNPTRADRHLGIAMHSTGHEIFTKGWFVDVLKELTFGPKLWLYPHRYNAIRPAIELLYRVDLPDIARDLELWNAKKGPPLAVKEVQRALLRLGYDLGPYRDDGVYGPATQKALYAFAERSGITDPEDFESEVFALLRQELRRGDG